MELIPELLIKDTKEFDYASKTDFIFDERSIHVIFPNKYKKQKLANEWKRDSLKDGRNFIKNGSAQFLSVVYLRINPTFNHGRLSHFFSTQK